MEALIPCTRLDDLEVLMASLRCPCGANFRTETDDELVEQVQEHLAEAHPGRTYSRDDILMLAAMS